MVSTKRMFRESAALDRPPAKSRALYKVGFTTLRDAESCANAVIADLEAGRIGAAEANELNDVIGRWRRAHIRKGGD